MNKYAIQMAFKNEKGSIEIRQKTFNATSPEEALQKAKEDFPCEGVIFSDPKIAGERKHSINIGTQIGGTIINFDSVSNLRIGD